MNPTGPILLLRAPKSLRFPHHLGWLWICIAMVGTSSTLFSFQIFVSPTGTDSATGSQSRPLASLEAARDRIRAARKSGQLKSGPVQIWLKGGTYQRTNSFEMEAQDSGSISAPVEISAWKNEPVLILGGINLTGFQKTSDPEIIARLPAGTASQVIQAPLPEGHFGALADLSMKSRGFARPLTRSHPELFVDGTPMTLARWPNEGSFTQIAGFPADSAQGDDHGGKIGRIENGFFYEGDRPKNWKTPGEIWVHGYWAWDWANSYEQIESIDLEKRWIRTLPPHGLYGFRKNQRFYFLNVLEELDAPGEWFLDSRKKCILLRPPAGKHPSEVLLSVLESPLIQLRNASHVRISGLRVEAGRSHGISITGGRSNRVESCAVRRLGNYGVWIDGGEGHTVSSCEITDTGDGGVSIAGGDRQTLHPGGHIVSDCHFRNQGRWSKCYVPAVLVSGVGHIVRNNHIEQHPHCAILFTGNDHRIEFNEIHQVALETGDVGAIYTGRDWTFRGNAILHNYIHHTGGVGMGSMGVYMDDCVSGTEIRGNIFEEVQRAVFLGGGRDHQVINNLFINCKPAVQLDGRGLDKSPVWHNMVFDFMKKQMDAVPSALYNARYPALQSLAPHYSKGLGVPPESNKIHTNICVGGEWISTGWHATMGDLDLKANYVGKDPGFKDFEKKDLRIKARSPAASIGFQPIPGNQIGTRNSPERKRLLQHVLRN